jgi:hypothetical protein
MKSPTAGTLIALLILALFSACSSTKPFYGEEGTNPASVSLPATESAYSLYLTGGVSLSDESKVLDAIRTDAVAKRGLILLGDVITASDLTAEQTLADPPTIELIKTLDREFKSLYLIPGQKEWALGKRSSLNSLNALDNLLKDVKDKGRFILPAKDCGQPTAVRVSDKTVVVLVDSQWAIEAETQRDNNLSGCELSNVLELRLALKDIIQSYPSDHIIIATHHPIFANGPTAGNYPLKSHLLPLPVLGTLITGIKSLIGSNQHFGHPAYEAYRAAMQWAVDGCKNCIIVSGHEQSLQYYNEKDKHYLVAGSGSDVEHARKGNNAEFAYMSKGYVRADELMDGNLQLSFFAVNDQGQSTIVWTKIIELKRNEAMPVTATLTKMFEGDSILLPASTRYSQKRFLRGEFYRKEWSTPINMKVLWLDKEKGGLKPKQLGGGNQTRSLRLENEKGEQYVLRSIDKKVTAVLPPALRGSFAENIVQDGIAASHPYGALVIPKLAEAAGVYYTNPIVVYVPHQPALGIYDQEIGDGVYLFEERPGGNTEGFANFGNTKETFSTADVLELIAESPEHIIDQKAVVRARLFDILLGDWDRHDDQWRWAVFKENGNKVYRPIPRDRDQVFYKNDGVLDYLASRPYFNPPLRKFSDKIDHLDGLVWAGKYFDRSFLNQLSRADFENEARSIQVGLTDEVIERAFKDWPAVIDEYEGARLRNDLRTRRDDLVTYAQEYYDHLAEDVFITATADKDLVLINAVDDHRLDITVTRQTKDGDDLYFSRLFDDRETDEIRIAGLEKTDSFRLTGPGSANIKLRIIGGSGEDHVINRASHLHPKVYDNTDGMQLTGGGIAAQLNDEPLTNMYDRTDWNLDRKFHFISPTYYTDEGFGLTYTYWLLRHGFRAEPYKSKHAASLSYFFTTGSFIGRYNGEWRHAIGSFDIGMHAYVTGPTFTQYWYGYGNDYVNYDETKKYHIVSGSQLRLEPSLKKRFGFGSTISLTPSYQFINIEDENEDPRFIYTGESGLSADDFGQRHYTGIKLGYQFERIDNAGYPTRGIDLAASIGARTAVSGENISHALGGFNVGLYLPFDVTGKIVLATHVGADRIAGDYEFFHALTLGGPDKVRGYKTDRFAGDSRVYHATDLRILLLNKMGTVPFRLGIYGAFDYGRVWYDLETVPGDTWHTAIGGGLFIAPLGIASFRLGYMVGEDDKQLNVGGALRF